MALSTEAAEEQYRQQERDAEASQPLEFPRGADTVVPEAIRRAEYELAFSLLDGVDPQMELENLSVTAQGYAEVRTHYRAEHGADRTSYQPRAESVGMVAAEAISARRSGGAGCHEFRSPARAGFHCWANTAAHFKAVVSKTPERTTTPCRLHLHRGCENSAMRNLYLSRAVLASFEGEGGGGAGDAARVPGLARVLAGLARCCARSRLAAVPAVPERAMLASPRRMSTGCWPTTGASIRRRFSGSRRCLRRRQRPRT